MLLTLPLFSREGEGLEKNTAASLFGSGTPAKRKEICSREILIVLAHQRDFSFRPVI